MIYFHKIKTISNPYFNNFYQLYSSAFPENEQRSYSGLIKILGNNNHFSANAILNNDKFIGIFNYWEFEPFYFIEHFAIANNLRGQHYGTDTMKSFLSQTQLPVVLEVELPNTEVAIKRIQFYERLGFSLLPNDYFQPPYGKEALPIPLFLMSNDKLFASNNFHFLKKVIHTEVYHFEHLS